METPELFQYAYQLEKDKQYDEAEDIHKSIIEQNKIEQLPNLVVGKLQLSDGPIAKVEYF